MKTKFRKEWILSLVVIGIVGGCSTFKPVVTTERYFLLTANAGETNAPTVVLPQPIGLAAVTVPGYLLQDRLAVRQGEHEVQYQHNLQWAERLDKNIHRALAANLGMMVGQTNVLLSGWRRDEVSAEVFVTIRRFDLNAEGGVTLEAQWLVSPTDGDRAVVPGHTLIRREGAPVAADAEAAVDNLSGALEELAVAIAQDLPQTK